MPAAVSHRAHAGIAGTQQRLLVPSLTYSFNEWFCALDGIARGQDWRSWSAALYLYAAAAVKQKRPPFFHDIARRVRTTKMSVPSTAD
jgi:hypothetical protein